MDQDVLFAEWGLVWSDTEDDPRAFQAQYKRADRLSAQARAKGLKVMGSLFWNFRADAIVLLPERQHRAFVAQRPDLRWDRVAEIRAVLKQQASRWGIPVFVSLDSAVAWIDQKKN